MRWLAAIAICACHGSAPTTTAPHPGAPATASGRPIPLDGFVHHDLIPAMGKVEGIWQIAADDAWAVDAKSTALHWDGRAWSIALGGERLAGGTPFREVWASGHDDVWIVAASAADDPPMHGDYQRHIEAENELLHWNGRAWTSIELPELHDGTLGQIHGSGPNDFWVSAHRGGDRDGRHRDGHASAFHWDGKQLVESTFDNSVATFSPWVSSPSDAWILSSEAHGHDVLWHWNGTQWSRERDIEHATAVWVDAGTVWVAADRELHHRPAAGGTWKVRTLADRLSSIRATPALWGWMGKDAAVWKGGSWRTVDVPAGFVTEAAGGTPGSTWLLGRLDGHHAAIHDNTVLTDPIVGTVARMAFAAPDDGWAITWLTDDKAKGRDADLYRWTQGAWQRAPIQPPFIPTAVWAMPGRAWIAGTKGELAIGDGTQWQQVPALGLHELSSFWGTKDDLWGGGCAGDVAHWDGSAWHVMPSIAELTPYPGVCMSIGGTSSNDLWAVAWEMEAVYHWDGKAWAAVTFGVDRLFNDPGGNADHYRAYAVWAVSPNDVWIIGGNNGQTSQPMMLHYDGKDWTRTLVPPEEGPRHRPHHDHGKREKPARWRPWPDHEMYAAWGRAANDIWAAGGNGDVVHYDGTTWSRIDASHGDRRAWLAVTGTPDGAVWFGGQHGSVMSLARDGKFAVITKPAVAKLACPAKLPEVAPDWWLAGDAACPAGAHLEGAPPPKGREVACVTSDGERHGPRTEFWTSGTKQSEGIYDHDQQLGVFTSYAQNGTKTNMFGHCGSVPQGPYARWTDTGQKLTEGEFVDGKLDGTVRAWSPTGRLLGTYVLSKGTGHIAYWYDDALKQSEGDLLDGKKEGMWTTYWGGGIKEAQGTYHADVRNGTWTSWTPQGKLQATSEYADGELEGTATSYDDAGHKKTFEYHHGFMRSSDK